MMKRWIMIKQDPWKYQFIAILLPSIEKWCFQNVWKVENLYLTSENEIHIRFTMNRQKYLVV